MKKPHLLARCLEPVAMTEEMLRVCIAIASDDAFFAEDRAKALAAAGGLPFGEARAPMSIVGGVATIAVDGPLVRKAAGVADVSGLTSYDAILKDFRAAESNPAVRSIDWTLDTPGGEVSGLFETADEIFAARGKKPMRALVTRANSAGYVLAAAIGNIQIEQMGQAGSVGVIVGAQRPDPEGNGVIEFYSSVSPKKNPNPTTDAGRAEYQARADYSGERLVEKVATYRGVTAEKVKADFGAGSVLLGAQAVAAGLADRVGFSSPTNEGVRRMNPTMLGLAADADEATVAARAQALVGFEKAALAATKAATSDEAIGAIAAAVESHAAVGPLRAELAALHATSNRRDLRAVLEGGLASGRLSLGRIRTAAVDMVAAVAEGPATTMRAALAAIPEKLPEGVKEKDAVLDAICSVDPGRAAINVVASYAKSATVTHGAPHIEPVEDPAAAEEHDARLDARAQEIAKLGAAARAHFTKPAAAAK